MPDTSKSSPHPVLQLGAALLAAGACLYAGYRIGVGRAFIRDKRLAEGPELLDAQPAEWAPPGGPAPAPGAASCDRNADACAPGETPQARPFSIDAAMPLRISWPLDVGPDDDAGARICLRARQGANEIQLPGTGKALYPFSIRRPGQYRAWCRVRWVDDGVGSVECNNSWFVAFDNRPAEVVGNAGKRDDWHWEKGPAAQLDAGEHWLRVELREDGVRMDRIAIVPDGTAPEPDRLDQAKPLPFGGCLDERPPLDPQQAVENVDCWALPTGSLVIGAGHVNEVTLGASYHGCQAADFSGRIVVRCPTAPGLVVDGDPVLNLDGNERRVRRTLRLKFPASAPRRVHRVNVAVLDMNGACVFAQELRFVKAYAWAFMGPFADVARGRDRRLVRAPAIDRLRQACDAAPRRLAMMQSAEALGLAALPMAANGAKLEWRVVANGACYDWTGCVDLRKVYGPTPPAFAYAATWIRAETNLHHRSFIFQCDDSGWLWMNGRVVASMPMDLPREAQRVWTSAILRKGLNPVVVKLTQHERYWAFRFDVVDWHYQGRRGDVITGVELEQWPRAKPAKPSGKRAGGA